MHTHRLVSHRPESVRRLAVSAIAASGLALGTLTAPAMAAPDGGRVVISEVYGGGGNSGAPLRSDFVELFNPTDADVDLAGLSLLYRSSSGSPGGSPVALSGTVPAGGHFLVKAADGSNAAAPALPDPDAEVPFAMSGTNGQVLLIDGSSFSGSGDVAGDPTLVDAVGYGSATTFETAATAPLSNTTSASRDDDGTDTDDNAADFSVGAPTPVNAGGPVDPPDPDPVDATIAEIQGPGDTSPLVGKVATTSGVVTATYPDGGYDGFYIQTGGTGEGDDPTPGRSDALFIYSPSVDFSALELGDSVEVTGAVSEFRGTTEITTGEITPLDEALDPVTPLAIAYPETEADREAHEGELLAPTDDFTVTNVFTLNRFAEIGLATGDEPLRQPTDVEDAQTGDVAGVAADNERRAVALDDGASIDFLRGDARNVPLPWLTPERPIRVGAPVTLDAPVVLEFRNDTWKFQPQRQVVDSGGDVASFANTRVQNLAPRDVGGDLSLATFNVLNYFNTTGADWVAAGNSCSFFTDRVGDPVANDDCGPTGPRGAAEDEDLERQQSKIAAAINLLGADVVSLEEIENSVVLGEDRDDALADLTDALNDAAGEERWAFVPSPPADELPPVSEQDVIRNAFIYDPSTVELVGTSDVLTGSSAFGNAREPLAQAFKQVGAADGTAFTVIVNHFKSKGSGVDDGTGQGNANPDRVAQAEALVDFAAEQPTDAIFLTGDFNAYTQEDPMQVLYGADYTKVESDEAGDDSYSFDGLSGSLDHVLANDAALALVTGADVWEINADESVAFQYSRHNYNVTDFVQPDSPFAASDHNPEIVGLSGAPAEPAVDLAVAIKPERIVVDRTLARVTVRVTRDGTKVRAGSVSILDGDEELARVDVVRGRARTTLPPFDEPGEHDLIVRYTAPDGQVVEEVVTASVTQKARPR